MGTTIIVLPFEDLSASDRRSHFTYAVHKGLIDRLSRYLSLKVASPSVSSSIDPRHLALPTLRTRLGFEFLVEGDIRQKNELLEVTTRLVTVATGVQRNDRLYSVPLQALESAINQMVTDLVQDLGLAAPAPTHLMPPTMSTKAYDHYLKGRVHLHNLTESEMLAALDCFDGAIQADQTFALAHAGISETYLWLGHWGYSDIPDALERAEEHALKALALDNTLVEALVTLAGVRAFRGRDWQGALSDIRRAVSLDIRSALAHFWHSTISVATGSFDEGLDHCREAIKLWDFNRCVVETHLGFLLFLARRFEDAANQCQKALELSTDDCPLAHLDLGSIYTHQKQYEDALRQFNLADGLPGYVVTACRGWTYGMWGKTDRAKNALGDLFAARDKGATIPPAYFAWIHTAIGDYDHALEDIERGLEQRDSLLIWLKVSPAYDPLRSHPRFNRLLTLAGHVSTPPHS